jgi:hypothetical protein
MKKKYNITRKNKKYNSIKRKNIKNIKNKKLIKTRKNKLIRTRKNIKNVKNKKGGTFFLTDSSDRALEGIVSIGFEFETSDTVRMKRPIKIENSENVEQIVPSKKKKLQVRK